MHQSSMTTMITTFIALLSLHLLGSMVSASLIPYQSPNISSSESSAYSTSTPLPPYTPPSTPSYLISIPISYPGSHIYLPSSYPPAYSLPATYSPGYTPPASYPPGYSPTITPPVYPASSYPSNYPSQPSYPNQSVLPTYSSQPSTPSPPAQCDVNILSPGTFELWTYAPRTCDLDNRPLSSNVPPSHLADTDQLPVRIHNASILLFHIHLHLPILHCLPRQQGRALAANVPLLRPSDV
jgi:hypothetical protein